MSRKTVKNIVKIVKYWDEFGQQTTERAIRSGEVKACSESLQQLTNNQKDITI